MKRRANKRKRSHTGLDRNCGYPLEREREREVTTRTTSDDGSIIGASEVSVARLLIRNTDLDRYQGIRSQPFNIPSDT